MRIVFCVAAAISAVLSASGCSSSSSAQGTMVTTETEFASANFVVPVVPLDSGLYLLGTSDDTGYSVYVTDLTEAGTTLLMEDATILSSVEGTLVWQGRPLLWVGVEGEESIWLTDGTPEGTELIVNLEPGPKAFTQSYARLDGDMLVIAGNPYDIGAPAGVYDAPKLITVELD